MTPINKTPLAHNCVKYKDSSDRYTVNINVYQSNNKIWSITIRDKSAAQKKEDCILVLNSAIESTITISDKITRKGLIFGMPSSEAAKLLKMKLNIREHCILSVENKE